MKKVFLAISLTLSVMCLSAQDVFNPTIEEWERGIVSKERESDATLNHKRIGRKNKIEKKLQLLDSLQKCNPDIIYTIVPRWAINDKVYIVNKSSYDIVQIAVTWIDDNNKTHSLGSLTNLASGKDEELVHFKGNGLRQLQNQILAVKAKGRKHTDLKDEQPLDSSLYTYSFAIRLSEERHDLFI